MLKKGEKRENEISPILKRDGNILLELSISRLYRALSLLEVSFIDLKKKIKVKTQTRTGFEHVRKKY